MRPTASAAPPGVCATAKHSNASVCTPASYSPPAEHGVQRIRRTHHLGYSFLRHCGSPL
jgi:hypothetical protein